MSGVSDVVRAKQVRNLNRVMKLNERHPDKYCWASLVCMALERDREERLYKKEDARTIHLCKLGAEENGECWCGKFSKH